MAKAFHVNKRRVMNINANENLFFAPKSPKGDCLTFKHLPDPLLKGWGLSKASEKASPGMRFFPLNS